MGCHSKLPLLVHQRASWRRGLLHARAGEDGQGRRHDPEKSLCRSQHVVARTRDHLRSWVDVHRVYDGQHDRALASGSDDRNVVVVQRTVLLQTVSGELCHYACDWSRGGEDILRHRYRHPSLGEGGEEAAKLSVVVYVQRVLMTDGVLC